MTDVIAKLRALDAEATSAPWRTQADRLRDFGRRPTWGDGGAPITSTPSWVDVENERDDADIIVYDKGAPSYADADLIVAARNHLGALLDAAELLRTIRATELHGSHVTLAAEIDSVLARLEETP